MPDPVDAAPAAGDDPDAPALRCEGLVRRFGTTVAVDHLDLTVPTGRLTAILGPSGCGKTTLLRLVAGLEDPDAGRIFIHGVPVASPGRSVPPERRDVGMVFQDYALFPHLSVADNVAYGLRSLGRAESDDRTREVLELVGLVGYDQRRPDELSGGQRQRVALARALAPSPQVVLLDEPFSNLDAGLREAVRRDVRSILSTAGATAVVVTHDQQEALSLADRVAVMAGGRIHQVATPHELYTRPGTRFVAEFVGDADVLPARRAGQFLVDTPMGRLPTRHRVPAEHTTAVVRPEALRVSPRSDGEATVEAITYFGHDQLVSLRLADGTRLRSRQGPDRQLHVGDRVACGVEGRVVVFENGAAGADPRPPGDGA